MTSLALDPRVHDTMMERCEFPLFRARYIDPEPKLQEFTGKPLHPVPINTSMHNAPTPAGRLNLKLLDLRSLPQPEDDGQSESVQRRTKIAFFEKHCSHIANGIYVSGEYPAKHYEVLAEHGITHVVNCVGFLYGEMWKSEGLTYKTYYLQDSPGEDIACVLYDAFDFIGAALASSGRVLVHCSQGVSRSATIAIAYLMWSLGKGFDETFGLVKAARGVASPNIGFTCQLLQWHRKRANPPARARLYRIAPHSHHAPLLLLPKAVTTPPSQSGTSSSQASSQQAAQQAAPARLDPRGSFVVHTPGVLFAWRGAECPDSFAKAAELAAAQLQRYEEPGAQLVQVLQGEEPPELLAAFQVPPASPMAAATSSELPSPLASPSRQQQQQRQQAQLSQQQQQQAPRLSAERSDCEMTDSQQEPEPEQQLSQQQQEQAGGLTHRPSRPHSHHQQQSQQQSQQQMSRLSSASTEAEAMDITPSPFQPAPGTVPRPALALGRLQGQPSGLGSMGRWSSSSSGQLLAAVDGSGVEGTDGDGSSAPASARSNGAAAGGVIVEEVDEYTEEYMVYYRALLHSGGKARAAAGAAGGGNGTSTPRSLAAAAVLSVDDSGTRPASPATNEGRHRKYRRSESERHISGARLSRPSQLSLPPLQLPFLQEQEEEAQRQAQAQGQGQQ